MVSKVSTKKHHSMTQIYSWTPKLIYQYLGEHVYGQEEAKRGAAMLVYNHLQGHRRNMLVAGPTGCGKTEIWRTLQKKFSFIKIINGPQLSCDGWKGSYHVKDIFLEEKPQMREHMIVVVDEADKLFEADGRLRRNGHFPEAFRMSF